MHQKKIQWLGYFNNLIFRFLSRFHGKSPGNEVVNPSPWLSLLLWVGSVDSSHEAAVSQVYAVILRQDSKVESSGRWAQS